MYAYLYSMLPIYLYSAQSFPFGTQLNHIQLTSNIFPETKFKPSIYIQNSFTASLSSTVETNFSNNFLENIFNRIPKMLYGPLNTFQKPFARLKKFFRNELPILEFIWPKKDFRLKSFFVLSIIFMFAGNFLKVKVSAKVACFYISIMTVFFGSFSIIVLE
jgi:hypothetical protein